MDRIAHLKHLQTVFREFDADEVISEPVLICLFCNSLRPSFCAQTKQDGCWKDIWEQAIKKAIITEAKTALNLPSWVRKIDTCYSRGHQSSPKVDECTKEKVSNQNFSRS